MLNPFKFEFVSDDLTIFNETENNKIEKPKNYFKYLWTIIRGDNYWRDDQTTPRVISIGIHVITSSLIFFAFGSNAISFLAAFLFLIHPCHTECSLWLSGKPYSRTAMFSMLAFMFPFAAPVIFLFPGVICVSGIFFPLIFLVTKYKILAALAIYTVISFSRWIFDKTTNTKLKGYEHNKRALKLDFSKIVIGLKFYGYYLINSIFGIHYCFYQSYMNDFIDTEEGIKKSTRIDLFFFVGLSAISTLAYCLLSGINHISVFGLLWATLNIGMWCNVVNTGQQYIANRYSYLPNIGLMIALSGVIINYPLLIGAVAALYVARLIPSIRQLSSVYWFFFYQIYDEPAFYFGWLHMGNLHFHRGQFGRAIGDYLQALSLRPNNFKALFNLSSAHIALKDPNKAFMYFEECQKADLYGQEEKATGVIKARMKLFNDLAKATKLKLKITDIDVVS